MVSGSSDNAHAEERFADLGCAFSHSYDEWRRNFKAPILQDSLQVCRNANVYLLGRSYSVFGATGPLRHYDRTMNSATELPTPSISTTSSSRDSRGLDAWQKRLMPFMVKMIIGMTVFFFLASSIQLYYLHRHMAQSFPLDLATAPAIVQPASFPQDQTMEFTRWKTLATLEQYALQRSYNQANIFLMARIWTRYLGFVTGMICTFIGAVFILGKFEESVSDAKSEAGTWKLSLTTASPGIMLSVLGTVLMVTTMLSPGRIDLEAHPVYLGNSARVGQHIEPPNELLDGIPAPTVLKTTNPTK
jgi:hypothetical protein